MARKASRKVKGIPEAVREICLSLPESEEYLSHGSPNFRVRGKNFASLVVNHHGDGRVALWINAPAGAQAHYVGEEPKHYFIPPYVGPRGWLGINLDRGISWKRVAAQVREAYEKVAPPALASKIGKTIEIEPPGTKLAAAELDPMQSPAAQRVLKKLRELCAAFPETSESQQFGMPVWLAGKKSFAQAYHLDGKLVLGFWVGVDRQGLLTNDRRFRIPPYMGHNGWIALDVSRDCRWTEIKALLLESYRHFALKRMLARLSGGSGSTQ